MNDIKMQIPEEKQKALEANKYPNIYAAIPPNGAICPHTGLKHAQLYKLLSGNGPLRDHVRVAHLTLPGVARGKTLFNVGDFLRYLDGLAAKQGSGLKSGVDCTSA